VPVGAGFFFLWFYTLYGPGSIKDNLESSIGLVSSSALTYFSSRLT